MGFQEILLFFVLMGGVIWVFYKLLTEKTGHESFSDK